MLKNQINNDEIKKLIRNLLNTNISELIEQLRIDSAFKILMEIEQSHRPVLNSDPLLLAELEYEKGQILQYRNRLEAKKCLHHAYKLNTHDARFIKAEIWNRLKENDITEVKNLLVNLPKDDVTRHAIQVALSNNPTESFTSEDSFYLHNYAFRQLILSALEILNKNDYMSIVYNIDKIKCPEKLKYSNTNDWAFILNYHRFNVGEIIIFNSVTPKMNTIKVAFDTYDRFYHLLDKTDVYDHYNILKGLYCYWGYWTNRDESWINEFQNIKELKDNEVKLYYTLCEASMLITVKREQEAFSTIISIKDEININVNIRDSFINCLTIMTVCTWNVDYLRWVISLCNEKKYLISKTVSCTIALAIDSETAVSIKEIILEATFENKTDKNILIQLCNQSIGENIDLNSFRDSINTLNDHMVPFAAMLLAANGESNLAYNILNDKVDENKYDIKHRIFLDVLSMSKEHRPHLYRILRNNRKNGFDKDLTLLIKEYNLSLILGESQNAYDIMSILYNKNSDNEYEFANMIKMCGLVHPERLIEFENKALDYRFKSGEAIVTVYRAFASNNVIATAAEILYRNRDFEDYDIRKIFLDQATIGPLHTISHTEYDSIGHNSFVLLSWNENGEEHRKTFQIKQNSNLGNLLIGKKKDDVVTIDITGDKRTYTVIGIYNKYFKLLSDYFAEIKETGGNDLFFTFKLDKDDLDGSLNKALQAFDPTRVNYNERRRMMLKKYSLGNLCLCNILSTTDIIGSYYNYMFSSFKIYVTPHKLSEHTYQFVNQAEVSYALDLTSLIMLFEYSYRTGIKYHKKFILPKYTYEYIRCYQKTAKYNISSDYYEAYNSGNLITKDKSYDIDIATRLADMLKWIKNNCEVKADENALAFSSGNESINQMLLSNLFPLLMHPNTILISDDSNMQNIAKIGMISTESYMYMVENNNDAASFTDYLVGCKYYGLNIDKDYIYNEFVKVEHGQPNKWVDISLNAERNPLMFSQAIDAGIMIANNTINLSLAKISLTNLYVMCFNSMTLDLLNNMWEIAMKYPSLNLYSLQFIKKCLIDARKICGR